MKKLKFLLCIVLALSLGFALMAPAAAIGSGYDAVIAEDDGYDNGNDNGDENGGNTPRRLPTPWRAFAAVWGFAPPLMLLVGPFLVAYAMLYPMFWFFSWMSTWGN